jgi:hypothetical protein
MVERMVEWYGYGYWFTVVGYGGGYKITVYGLWFMVYGIVTAMDMFLLWKYWLQNYGRSPK